MNDGGGICAYLVTNVSIDHSYFIANGAIDGGGAYINAVETHISNTKVSLFSPLDSLN